MNEYLTEEACIILLQKTLIKFYEYDRPLINNDVHEIAMAFRLGMYLQKNIAKKTLFDKCQVDIEYNRYLDEVKTAQDSSKKIRPDIVVHQRGNILYDKIYIEIKKDISNEKNRAKWLTDWREDIKKIKMATKKTGGKYQYEYGIFLLICNDSAYYGLFKDGEILHNGKLEKIY